MVAQRLIELVSGNARRCFEATNFVDLHAIVANSLRHAFQNILREVLSRRLQFIKRRQLVDVSVVQVSHNFIRRRFQLNKIDQQTDVVQLASARVDLDLVVVACRFSHFPL